MDYCKSHGFYDQWYSQHGDNWFEREGRRWFDAQDALAERRTGQRILPLHLCDAYERIERANNNKADGSLTNVILEAVGLSEADARRAENWEKSDKFGKREIVIDHAFDIIGSITHNQDLVDAFRRLTKANNQYLKNKHNSETSDVAMSNMVLDLSNIVFDAYEKGVENRKAYLAEKLNIKNKLVEMGQDPSFASEVAGTILSIQNSKDLTEHEKKEWLRLLGFYGDEESVIEISKSISRMSENQAKNLIAEEKAKKIREEEEIQRRELEEKLRKERQRNEAISSINGIVVDSYLINESSLNDSQREALLNIVEILTNQNDISVEIIGNTCDLGLETVNEKIGTKRAEIVKEYLMDSGVQEDRLSVSTNGEKEPVVENTNSQNRKKNRRVVFIAK